MSVPPNTEATGIGEGSRKILGGSHSGRKQRDLGDPLAVLALAQRCAAGDPRGVTGLSMQETRAIARLACASFAIAAAAIHGFERDLQNGKQDWSADRALIDALDRFAARFAVAS